MMSLLSKLSETSKSAPIEPREIFMTLPQKDANYKYPRDVQTQVWKKWYEVRNEKNNVIKMNTGSGKTVVGLMILQSCLNEGKGPAIYVVPDNYLVAQVCEEAKKLGISVATDRDDYLYTEKKAILVTSVYSLVNGRTVFGMRKTDSNYPIGSILMDDVHACFDKIITQFSIRIQSDHKLYKKFVNLFAESWKSYNSKSYSDIVESHDPVKSFLVPFWVWKKKQKSIYDLLSKFNTNDEENHCIYFNLPLLEECLNTCDCFITARGIEIIPEAVSIFKIKSFIEASRRIFMSATLSDDSVLTTAAGIHKEDIRSIITPDSADDIGDRLILFPRHLNNAITNDEIKNKILEISRKHNTVVIVPSFEKAKYWDPDGEHTVESSNIENQISVLKKGHVGLVVFVNRYDGIDLPEDACRMLVIDGLPPLRNEKDKYIQSIDSSSTILKREQIQRIEQGMGRGVRSNSDSCCIVLMGDNLGDVLLRNNGTDFFSSATKEQYNLSKKLWDLLKQQNDKPSVDDIFELANYSLNRELEWIENSKKCLTSALYTSEPCFDENILALRKASEFVMISKIQSAIDILDKTINDEQHDLTKGYLLQVKAKYANLLDEAYAQQVLMAGKNLNMGVLSPIDGIRYNKSINNVKQAKGICRHIRTSKIQKEQYVLYVDSILSKLEFSADSNNFEQAFCDLGSVLGFVSTRPDKETNGEGPDNLWAMEGDSYLVVECKNAAYAETISKDYCNQLGGSQRWFLSQYKGSATHVLPVMVHKSTKIDSKATIVDDMRVIDQAKLESMKDSVKNFAIAVSQDCNWLDETIISGLLSHYDLRSEDIARQYTCRPIHKI